MEGMNRNVWVLLLLVRCVGHGGSKNMMLEPVSVWSEFESYLEQGRMCNFNYCQSFYSSL